VLIAGPQRALLSAPVGTLVVVLKALALLCGIAGAWVLAALARALGLGARAGLAAAILVALDPALTFSRAAGMEVPLFTLLVLLALLMAVRGRLLAAGAATGLAIVARPEGLVLLPVLALMLARGEVLRAPRAGRRLAGALGLALLPALLEVAFCLHAVGTPLPNTFYVKLAGSAADLPRRLALGWSDYVHGDLPYFTLEAGTGLALLGAAMMLRRAPRLAGGVLAAGVLLFAGTLASREFAPGHFHYWERWLLPAVPVLLLAIAVGLTTLAGAAARLLPAGRPAATAIAAAILAAVLLARWPGALVDRAGQYAWNCRNIEELDVAAGRWVDRTLPRDAVVATSDAGAIRYFGRRTTVDLSGLNDHRMRIALAQREGERQLERAGVGWFTIFPFAYPDLMGRLRLTRVHTLSAAHYTICEAPQDTLAIYRWDRGAR